VLTPGSYPPPLFWQSSAIGFVLTLLTYWARSHYPWLWLNPIGFVLGGTSDTWFRAAMVTALVVKLIVVRIGGTEAYTKYLQRFAVGAFVSSYAAEFLARYVAGRGLYFWLRLAGTPPASPWINLFAGFGLIVPVLFFALPIAALIVPRIRERVEKKKSEA
jgi:hypothetical protein